MALEDMTEVEEQIRERQKIVDYDVKEYTIKAWMSRYDKDEIFIPDYQRAYVWEEDMASKFIESILLDLPLPYIFAADNDGKLEIVDGSQRLRTISAFVKNDLCLQNLTELDKLNGLYFVDLLPSRQDRFLNTYMRVVVLSKKSSDDVKRMVFKRINRGGTLLSDMEARVGVYYGDFIKFLKDECVKHPLFKQLVRLSETRLNRAEAEELVMRFFAYSDRLQAYDGNQREFLDKYAEDKTEEFKDKQHVDIEKKRLFQNFDRMLNFINTYLPNAFSKNGKKFSYLRFEAISVGVHLALEKDPGLNLKDTSWLEGTEFDAKIKGSGTSSAAKVKGRIEFVKNKLLDRS